MFSFIKYKLSQRLAALLRNAQKYEIEQLLKNPNVEIDKTVIIGEYTNFSMPKDIKALKIKSRSYIRRYCNFLLYPGASLVIGENVFFNNNCSINCLASITIGDNTLFGEGVKIYDHNHLSQFSNDTLYIDREKYSLASISIGKNCWIGSNVTILKGVTIGDNTIIGANCLIHKSIPSNVIIKNEQSLIIVNK